MRHYCTTSVFLWFWVDVGNVKGIKTLSALKTLNATVYLHFFFVTVAVCLVKPEPATKKGHLNGFNTSKSGHTGAIVSPVGALWNLIKRCLLRQRRLRLKTKSLVVALKRREFGRLLYPTAQLSLSLVDSGDIRSYQHNIPQRLNCIIGNVGSRL